MEDTLTPSPTTSAPTPDVPAVDEKAISQKALLAEARATRDVLVDFRSAIESGSYNGHQMMKLAKGLAFLEAILAQNQAHIKRLSEVK
jgi:hypothetical protein